MRNLDDLNYKLDKFLKRLKAARFELYELNKAYDELNGKNLTISVETEDEKVKQG